MKNDFISKVAYVLLMSVFWAFLNISVIYFLTVVLETSITLTTAFFIGAVMFKLTDCVAWPLSDLVKKYYKGE